MLRLLRPRQLEPRRVAKLYYYYKTEMIGDINFVDLCLHFVVRQSRFPCPPPLGKEDNEKDDERYQDRKDFDRQCPVGPKTGKCVREDVQREVNVGVGVVHIVFYPLDQVLVFRHHDGQFIKDGTQLDNLRFNRRHGIGPLLQIVLIGNELHHLTGTSLFFHSLYIQRSQRC